MNWTTIFKSESRAVEVYINANDAPNAICINISRCGDGFGIDADGFIGKDEAIKLAKSILHHLESEDE